MDGRALFENGDFRADHKTEALTIRRKVKATIRKAQRQINDNRN